MQIMQTSFSNWTLVMIFVMIFPQLNCHPVPRGLVRVVREPHVVPERADQLLSRPLHPQQRRDRRGLQLRGPIQLN